MITLRTFAAGFTATKAAGQFMDALATRMTAALAAGLTPAPVPALVPAVARSRYAGPAR